jgi:hypothetical protein
MMTSMRIESLRREFLSSCFVCLLFAAAVSGRAPDHETGSAGTQSPSTERNHVTQRSKFNCLPEDVRLDEVVTYGKSAKANVTVEKRLIEMRGQCRNGKLVDSRRREIRFFRPSCWGNPPPDYLEIQQREHAELEKLKRSYAVIAFGCNRMIS